MQKAVLIYLAVIGLVSVTVCIADKRRAKQHRWRVPERTLLILSTLGGSIPMLLTMLIIRHKTRHAKFMIGIPCIILLQFAAVFFLYRFGVDFHL